MTGVRSLIGCGVTWLPQHTVNKPADVVEVSLWKPTFKHDDNNSLGNMFSYDDIGGKHWLAGCNI